MAANFETLAQSFVYTRLNGNITASVYDHVPHMPDGAITTNYPFVAISDGVSYPWDTDDNLGMEVDVILEVYSRTSGMSELKTAINQIYNLLHRATGSGSGYRVVDSLFQTANFATSEDGKTRRAILRYRITLCETGN